MKNNKAINDILKNIVEEIKLDEIENKKNKLECICLNICSKDENNFEILKKEIIKKTNKNFSKNIKFLIVQNKKFNLKIEELNDIFHDVEIINIDLSPKDDLYVPYKLQNVFLKNKIPLPEYGTKSGPNIMFLKSMRLLKTYNTSLFLEPDCLLGSEWLEKLYNYVEHSNGFWISGATYDGTVYSDNVRLLHHINGVALYATGNDYFQIFINNFEDYLKESIKQNPCLAYDWAIESIISDNLKIKDNQKFWKFIKRNYVVNNLIFNYCLEEDKLLDEEKIMKMYNYAILHKKHAKDS